MEIGTKAPAFTLKNTNGQEYSLEDLFDRELLVIVFTCNHCPYAKAYVERIKGLAEGHKHNVHFVLINSNDAKKYPEDSFEEMRKVSRLKGYFYPYLYDETQEVAKAYGAECTPHVFVFGKDRTLIYEGLIDDNWKDPDLATNTYLQDAIDSALIGAEIRVKETDPIGCSIKWK